MRRFLMILWAQMIQQSTGVSGMQCRKTFETPDLKRMLERAMFQQLLMIPRIHMIQWSKEVSGKQRCRPSEQPDSTRMLEKASVRQFLTIPWSRDVSELESRVPLKAPGLRWWQ